MIGERLKDSAAQQLLGSNYRENCEYTLDFTEEGVFVNRVDKRFAEDETVVENGIVVDGYLMTFKLDNDAETESEIMSFDEMVKQSREDYIPKPTKPTYDMYSVYEKQKPPVVTIILLIWMTFFILVGIYLTVILLK